jgi:hypothetical protein
MAATTEIGNNEPTRLAQRLDLASDCQVPETSVLTSIPIPIVLAACAFPLISTAKTGAFFIYL